MVLISNSQIGDDFDGFGSCKGDSGGPVIRFNSEREHFEQIAVVQGGIGACGDRDIPGIYARLRDPGVFAFITQKAAFDFGTRESVVRETADNCFFFSC